MTPMSLCRAAVSTFGSGNNFNMMELRLDSAQYSALAPREN